MIQALRAAAASRVSRTAQENAISDVLSSYGAHGDFHREGDTTIFATNAGTFLLSDGEVRIANQGKPRAVDAAVKGDLTQRKLQNIADEHATERRQLQAVATALHNAGEADADKPRQEETRYQGKIARVYTWETSIGTVALITGPQFAPDVQVITKADADAAWAAMPKGAYAMSHGPRTTTRSYEGRQQVLDALGALRKREKRTKKGERKPRRQKPTETPAEQIIEAIEADAPIAVVVEHVEALTKPEAIVVADAFELDVKPEATKDDIQEAIIEVIAEELPSESVPKVKKPRGKKKVKSQAEKMEEFAAIFRNALASMPKTNPRRHGQPWLFQ